MAYLNRRRNSVLLDVTLSNLRITFECGARGRQNQNKISSPRPPMYFLQQQNDSGQQGTLVNVLLFCVRCKQLAVICTKQQQ